MNCVYYLMLHYYYGTSACYGVSVFKAWGDMNYEQLDFLTHIGLDGIE